MKIMDKNTFITKCNEIHNYRYNYDKVNYINSRNKVIIGCKIHGDFEQIASNHLRGQNCPKCSCISKKRRKFKEFYNLLSEKSKYKYKYIETEFAGNDDKIKIICPIHGEFEQRVRNHLESKEPCFKCSRKEVGIKNTIPINILLNKFSKIHKNYYKYIIEKETYNRQDIIKLECPIHGQFKINISNHLNKSGCKKCSFKGYSRSEFINFCKRKNIKKAILYLINIYNKEENFYKIGITSNNIKTRFRKLEKTTKYKYNIIKIIKNTPRVIWEKENTLKKYFKDKRYTPNIIFAGYTECFNLNREDIKNIE